MHGDRHRVHQRRPIQHRSFNLGADSDCHDGSPPGLLSRIRYLGLRRRNYPKLVIERRAPVVQVSKRWDWLRTRWTHLCWPGRRQTKDPHGVAAQTQRQSVTVGLGSHPQRLKHQSVGPELGVADQRRDPGATRHHRSPAPYPPQPGGASQRRRSIP